MFTIDQMLSVELVIPNTEQVSTDSTNMEQENCTDSTNIKQVASIRNIQEVAGSSTDAIMSEGQSSTSTVEKTKQKKTRKKVMGSQAREVIALVYKQMKKEARNGVENVTDARWRTSQATGVSQKTVTRILKEKKTSEETGSPMRSPHRNKKPRKCIKRNMKEADVEVIKHTISNYQSQYNKPPTLYDLKKLLEESIHFVGCIETLRSVLFEIGYEFIPIKNHSSRHKKLVEKHKLN